MNPSLSVTATQPNTESLAAYYRLHAWIYDLTRWAFLFGRGKIIRLAAEHVAAPGRILEIGCGTGRNLVDLARAFPGAQITGLDLSEDMLRRARPKVGRLGGRVTLLHQRYDGPLAREKKEQFDLVVFSYALTMMNPGFDEVLDLCRADLSENGAVAVVDFHDSRWGWFRRWMGVNHVRMEGQVLERLRQGFKPDVCQIRHGYGGLWRYVLFVGRAAKSL